MGKINAVYWVKPHTYKKPIIIKAAAMEKLGD